MYLSKKKVAHTTLQSTGFRSWSRFLAVILQVITHTHLMALCPGLPGWAGTRKVKPIWLLLKQETVSGSGISWAMCKSAPRSSQITMPAPHRSVFYRPDALPAAQPTASKHWKQVMWVINPAVGCRYFLPGLQLPPQPLRGLLPILLLGEQRHSGCEQFAQDCYPTVSRLLFEPGPFWACIQHANHSATEPSLYLSRPW